MAQPFHPNTAKAIEMYLADRPRAEIVAECEMDAKTLYAIVRRNNLPIRQTGHAGGFPPHPNRFLAIEMYKAKKSLAEISAVCGMNRSSIHYNLQKYGIPLRLPQTAPAILALHDTGATPRMIADALELRPSAVRNCLYRRGLRANPPPARSAQAPT